MQERLVVRAAERVLASIHREPTEPPEREPVPMAIPDPLD
jgi:hypothetical protein